MTDYDMSIYEYRKELKEYLKLAKTKNPVSVMFNRDVAKEFAKNLVNTMGLEVIEENLQTEQQKMPFSDKKE